MSKSIKPAAAFVRVALFSAAVAGFAGASVAQEGASDESLAEVTVTGSRIARTDASAVGPVMTLSLEDIEAAAPLSVGELLQELPGAGVSLNSNGTQGTSFGVSAVNLRYLGSSEGSGNRVLVLVDGHRWVNAAGGRGFRDFVDLNTIPLGMVETIEVLKDGASAIYGADAIAGVVNIRTRKEIEGIETRLSYGETSESDGASLSASKSYGTRERAGDSAPSQSERSVCASWRFDGDCADNSGSRRGRVGADGLPRRSLARRFLQHADSRHLLGRTESSSRRLRAHRSRDQ